MNFKKKNNFYSWKQKKSLLMKVFISNFLSISEFLSNGTSSIDSQMFHNQPVLSDISRDFQIS